MGRAFGGVHRTRNFEISGESHGAIRVQATNFANAAKFAPVPELQAGTETWKFPERSFLLARDRILRYRY